MELCDDLVIFEEKQRSPRASRDATEHAADIACVSPNLTGPLHCILFLFDLILYVPSTIFQLCRDGSSLVEPILS